MKKLINCVQHLHGSLFTQKIIDDDRALHKAITDKSDEGMPLSDTIRNPLSLYDKLREILGIDHPLLPVTTALLNPPSDRKKLIVSQPTSPDRETPDCTQDIEQVIQMPEKHYKSPVSPAIEITEHRHRQLMLLREEICKYQYYGDIKFIPACQDLAHEMKKIHGRYTSSWWFRCHSSTILSILNTMLDNAYHNKITHMIIIPDIFSQLIQNYPPFCGTTDTMRGIILSLIKHLLSAHKYR